MLAARVALAESRAPCAFSSVYKLSSPCSPALVPSTPSQPPTLAPLATSAAPSAVTSPQLCRRTGGQPKASWAGTSQVVGGGEVVGEGVKAQRGQHEAEDNPAHQQEADGVGGGLGGGREGGGGALRARSAAMWVRWPSVGPPRRQAAPCPASDMPACQPCAHAGPTWVAQNRKPRLPM
jgi:hypothetical protein